MTLQHKSLISNFFGIVLLVAFICGGSAVEQPKSSQGENSIVIESSSGRSELLLAQHLAKIHAKVYTAYWCPHCHDQLSLFGVQAAQQLERVECDPQGKDAQPLLCEEVQIESYPTWIINGQRHLGTQSLEALANASGYEGPRQFKNLIP
jgi:glutaredoxin